jgi:hypothetical protein
MHTDLAVRPGDPNAAGTDHRATSHPRTRAVRGLPAAEGRLPGERAGEGPVAGGMHHKEDKDGWR